MRKFFSNSPKNCTEKNSKILKDFILINPMQQILKQYLELKLHNVMDGI